MWLAARQLYACRTPAAVSGCEQGRDIHPQLPDMLAHLCLCLPTVLPQQLTGREVCCYSISCKQQNNIDITLEWLTKHAKS
jgi:hypothetical protein